MSVGNPLLAVLARRRILLAANDGQLRFRAPEGAVDGGVKDAIRANKERLLAALSGRDGFVQLGAPSYNQLSLFLASFFDPQSPAYNLALTMRVPSSVTGASIQEAASRLVHQHEQLRTTLGHLQLGGVATPCQFVAERLAPDFVELDASSWSDADLRERVQAFYREPIDLQFGPVVQTRFFVSSGDTRVLVLKFHHVAADGWSLHMLGEDLGRHIREVSNGLPDSSSERVSGSYSDYALEQIEFVRSVDGVRLLDYWKNVLTPLPPNVDLRGSANRPEVRRSRGATLFFEIAPALQKRVAECAISLGVTTFALQLAVFQQFLLERSGLRDIVVGVPTLGRRGEKFQSTVGNFINPVALRVRRPKSLTFGEHASLTYRELSEAIDHREAPFTAVMEQIGGKRDPSRTVGFQYLFNVLSQRTLGNVVNLIYPWKTDTDTELGGLPVSSFAIDQQEGQFDLTLELIERSSSALGILKYCTDLFSASEAATMVGEYRDLLERGVSEPNRAILAEIADRPAGTSADQPSSELAITATFTAEAMDEAFAFWFHYLDWPMRTVYAPFNQVFQTLLDPSSALRQLQRGFGVVLVRFDDLLAYSNDDAQGNGTPEHKIALSERLAALVAELAEAVTQAAPTMKVPLCFTVALSSPRLRAAIDNLDDLVASLQSRLQGVQGVHVLTQSTQQRWYPVDEYYEPLGEKLGSIPYTQEYLLGLAAGIVRMMHATRQTPIKALAVDCDGTLWEGVAAEDGVAHITIDGPQRRFQEFLLGQVQAGVILCLCSKNQESDVWTVFDQHPKMVLKREHVGFWRINWQPKSRNILELADEIGIGLDAIAFLDDNPIEREDVRSNCPPVVVIDLPVAWEHRHAYMEQLWPLDHVRVTEADKQRAAHYKSDRERTNLQRSSASLSEFLDRLGLQVDIREASSAEFDRLGQLSVRTNQFNSTVQRMDAKQIANYSNVGESKVFATFVRDRFGDYGLVGALLAKKVEDSVIVDSFLLSCRALGRGVEHRMSARAAEYAMSLGCGRVHFPVTTTERNEPVRKFLESLSQIGATGSIEQGMISVPCESLKTLTYDPCSASNAVPAGNESKSAASRALNTQAAWSPRVIEIPNEIPNLDELRRKVLDFASSRRKTAKAVSQASTPTKPASELERTVAEAWQSVLGMRDISTSANFFELGGTSVLLAQLAIALKHRGLDASIVDLLQYPTVALLAAYLSPAEPTNVSRIANTRVRPEIAARRAAQPFAQLRDFRRR
jgi:FkbH-like protein